MKNKKFKILLLIIYILFNIMYINNNIHANFIPVKCESNRNSFLDAVCNDLNHRFNKNFKANYKSIHSGMNSKIFLLSDNKSKTYLCLKVFNKKSAQIPSYLLNEHLIYYSLANVRYDNNFFKHIYKPLLPNITFPIATYTSSNFCGSIMRYNNMFTIGKLINKKVKLEEKYVASIAYDIMKGINSIHNAADGVPKVHHDLHPDNIMFHNNGQRAECFIIDSDFVSKPGKKFSQFPGQAYHAPENLLKKQIYNCKSEIFTIGTYLWVLVYGTSCPFGGRDFLRFSSQQHHNAIKNLPNFLKKMKKDETLSKNLRDFLAKILDPNPIKRLSAKDALGHPFLKSKKDIPANVLNSIINK